MTWQLYTNKVQFNPLHHSILSIWLYGNTFTFFVFQLRLCLFRKGVRRPVNAVWYNLLHEEFFIFPSTDSVFVFIFCRPWISGRLGLNGVNRRSPPPVRVLCNGLWGLSRLQFWTTCQRRPPHKVIRPRPILLWLCHHGHSQTHHAAWWYAVRHYRCLPKGNVIVFNCSALSFPVYLLCFLSYVN